MKEATTKSGLREKYERLADYLEAVYEDRAYRNKHNEKIIAKDVPEDAEPISS